MGGINSAHCTICGEAWTTEVVSHDHSNDPQKTPKRIRKDNGRRTRRVSVARMQLQARTILAREMDKLMEVSYERKLERDEAVSLRGYIELLNELEELDKIAMLDNQPKKDK